MRMPGRLAREPLVQFFVLGAALFVAHAAFGPDEAPPPQRIVIDARTVALLEERHARAWGARPDAATRERLIEDRIAEEVLYREALAPGLDRDDATIRRQLRQKMQFLLQDSLAVVAPDAGELHAYFTANHARYTEPARYSFEQVFLGSDAEVAALRMATREIEDPTELARPSLLPRALNEVTAEGIDRVFGAGFVSRIASLEPDRWEGPVESAFGLHLVRLGAVLPAHLPGFESVRDRVAADLAQEQAQRAEADLVARLRARYEIVIERAGE